MKAFTKALGFTLLLFCLSAATLQAQRGRSWVNGLVFDESETHGVAGATVSLIGDPSSPRVREVKLETKTDEEGKYYFKDVAYGDYTFRVAAPGFAPYEISLYVATDTLTALHVKLRKDPQGKKEGGAAMAGDLSRIDHIILGINDLQRGIDELERLTGVRAVFGGAHPGRGTQNALMSLGGAHYLEILAPNPKEPGNGETFGNVKSLTSLTPVGWAVNAGGNLAALRESLSGQGVQTGDIEPGARNRPDGTRLAWQSTGFANLSNPLLPFFIEWDPTSVHPASTSPEGCRLTGFTLEDPNPDTLRKPLQAAGVLVDVREGKEPRLRIAMACPKGNVELR
jgi:Glyoxalase-like domain/Carboxypeptidase regulatory-like domain